MPIFQEFSTFSPNFDRVISKTKHQIKILRSVLQKQSSLLSFDAGRAQIGSAGSVQSAFVSEKCAMDPLPSKSEEH